MVRVAKYHNWDMTFRKHHLERTSSVALQIPKDLSDYLLQNDMTPKEIIADAQKIISQLRHQTYYPPSVLGFFNSEIGPAKKNLIAIIPCSNPSSGDDKEWGGFHAIWHKGRWKFIFWEEK